MLMFIQIIVLWFETLYAVLLVNTRVLELPVSSIFKVEVSRVMMWACFIGMNSAYIVSSSPSMNLCAHVNIATYSIAS